MYGFSSPSTDFNYCPEGLCCKLDCHSLFSHKIGLSPPRSKYSINNFTKILFLLGSGGFYRGVR